MYKPRCAYSCQSAVPKMIECPGVHHDHGSMAMGDMHMTPSPDCLATNPIYLQSLAWCIHTHCDTAVASVPELEKWWVLNVAGRNTHQPVPNITYQEAVEQVETPPTEVLGEHDMMNRTVLTDEDAFTANDNIYRVFEQMETNHSTWSLVVIVSSAAIPIALSLLRFVPWPAALVSRFNSLLIDPPAFGAQHAQPIKNLATVPTRGQAISISYLIVINVLACSLGIYIVEPNTWYTKSWYQVLVYISNRSGAISFANVPLLILFSSRNNLLLWVTDWSHSTFLLLHRYIAWLCTIEACLHSAIYLNLYLWKQTHAEESKLPYWYWGIIGTLALSLLLPLSVRPIRSAVYEAFRVIHIFLAIMVIVGSYYHIIERYGYQWGYELWMYVAMAVWAFDCLARVARIARGGVRRGYVSRINEDYLRVDIPGIEAQGHVYAYFPSLTWRVWENHPFSVVSTSSGTTQLPTSTPSSVSNVEKSGATGGTVAIKSSNGDEQSVVAPGKGFARSGITLLIRAHAGATGALASKVGLETGVPVLIESSYGHEASCSHPTADFPNTICIAGGVGITAVLPTLSQGLSLHASQGSNKLFWGVRDEALVDAVESLIADVHVDGESGVKTWARHVETHVVVGQRLNLREILEQELSSGIGTTVLVSGPEGMADDVRNIVSGLGRGTAVVRFVEESFSW